MPSTAKSTKLSLSGVISVSAMEWASRVRWLSDPGGVDDDEIVRLLDRGERVDEAGELDRLVVVELASMPRGTQKWVGIASALPERFAQSRRFSM